MTEQTVKVPNISCGHCVKTIEREVGELEGVTGVSASEGTKEVELVWDDARTSWEEIRALISEVLTGPAA